MLYLLVLTDPELSYDNYSEDFTLAYLILNSKLRILPSIILKI